MSIVDFIAVVSLTCFGIGYSFGGTQVGTAVVEDPSQESSSDVLENDENMDSAKAYSESRSQIPYFAIGGVGILLLILLLWRMIRIIRS